MRDHPSIGGGEFTIVLDAIQRCLEIPMIRVVNMSFSTGEKSQAFRDAVESLAAANKVVVAAAGNHFTEGNPTVYPAAYPTVIAVGAVDAAGARGAFSCTGPHVALVAPGVGVVSTVPRKPHFRTTQTHYAALNGTSMAAPHVSAAVTLLLAKHADLTPEQVRDRLVKSARRLPGMPKTGRTDELGYGLLDLERLLQ
jgi:subtilisin family serine protease